MIAGHANFGKHGALVQGHLHDLLTGIVRYSVPGPAGAPGLVFKAGLGRDT